jgi:hypothetical protein
MAQGCCASNEVAVNPLFIHHKNTEKVARHYIVLGSNIKTPQQTRPEELREYDLIGFGSGIYGSTSIKILLGLAERLPEGATGRRSLSTSGAPALFDRYDASYRRETCANATCLRERLQSKGMRSWGIRLRGASTPTAF